MVLISVDIHILLMLFDAAVELTVQNSHTIAPKSILAPLTMDINTFHQDQERLKWQVDTLQKRHEYEADSIVNIGEKLALCNDYWNIEDSLSQIVHKDKKTL